MPVREKPSGLSVTSKEMLDAILQELLTNGVFPPADPFRRLHLNSRETLDELLSKGLLKVESDRYVLTLDGLTELGTKAATLEIEASQKLLAKLGAIYRDHGNKRWTTEELAAVLHVPPPELAKELTIL